MMTGNKDIRNIIAGSELKEMAEFLVNPANSITDCVICYQTDDEVGYQILGGSSIATLIGLLELTINQMSDITIKMFDSTEGE